MLRKICSTLLCLAVSCSTTSFAMGNNAHRYSGMTLTYILTPNKVVPINNYFFASITATCEVSAEENEYELQIAGLAKKGKINDMPLVAGQTLHLTVKNNDHVRVFGESGARINITNLGLKTVVIACQTSKD